MGPSNDQINVVYVVLFGLIFVKGWFDLHLQRGIYRHFKGNEYELLYIAKHSETLEDMIVYKALYGDGGIWVRPLSMWNETVEYQGKKVKRFEYTGATS